MKPSKKQVSLPNTVQISVSELYRLRKESAMLNALLKGGIKRWIGMPFCKWLYEHDPEMQDIRLGEGAGDPEKTLQDLLS